LYLPATYVARRAACFDRSMARVFRIFATALVALVACDAPLDRKRLHGEIEELRSIAQEARLEIEISDPASAYHGQQRAQLAGKLAKVRSELARGVEPHLLEPARERAEHLASRLEPLLLASRPAGFGDLAAELATLEDEVPP
jgi:hypothetical protein